MNSPKTVRADAAPVVVDVDSTATPFYVLTPGCGSTPAEPRFMVTRHQVGIGIVPRTVGFVFRRKSGRWGGSVVPMCGDGTRHVMAFDVPRLSCPDRAEALRAIIDAYVADEPGRAS